MRLSPFPMHVLKSNPDTPSYSRTNTIIRFPTRWLMIYAFATCISFLKDSHDIGWGAEPAVAAIGSVNNSTHEPSINIYPKELRLDHARDLQGFVVQLTRPDGTTVDITDDCKYRLDDENLVRRESNRIYPVRDGQTALDVSFAGLLTSARIVVANAKGTEELSFRKDIIPVITKAGCNTGACHGSARGKDGFRLSLFGFDPDGDHLRLVNELPGRRINLGVPEKSLMLRKATGDVAHTGGELFDTGSSSYAKLMEWLKKGAPNDSGAVAKPIQLETFPPLNLIEGEGIRQRMIVRATYSDGTDRDVTDLAVFLTNNDNSAKVDSHGIVTSSNRGEAFVMARFGTFTVGSEFLVLREGQSATRQASPPTSPSSNTKSIDSLVEAKLQKMRIEPSEICTDEEFARRLFIDLTGAVPKPSELSEFLSNPNSNRREALIDTLLEKDEFVDLWTMKWGEILRIRSANQVSFKALFTYHHWLRDRLKNRVPLNDIVRELISANGSTFSVPPTNYYQIESNKQLLAQNVAQVFLGMRVQCAQCHNHPFDRWTMDDYYGFLSFFGQVGFKQSEDPREFVIFNSGVGETRHLVDDRVMQPKFLGGDVPNVADQDYRAVLAKWLADKDNPFFAKHMANIVWAHHFGRGIVDPVDDVRVSNPPSNAELLDELGSRFAEYQFDLRRFVKDIVSSKAYQRSTKPNPSNVDDLSHFSRATIRRMRAEVLLDSISQVTDTKERFPRLPAGARAVEIVDGAVTNYFLTTFGRATRNTVCSCEVNVSPNLSQALHLLNGENTTGKIEAGKCVSQLIERGESDKSILTELYLRSYSRRPSREELDRLTKEIAHADNRELILNDIFWALLNSKEFIFIH